MLLRILLFLIPISSFCQNQFRFDHFSIKDGLSQNTVNCVLKDQEGYYWFGTQDGLNRYDGYSVVVYRHERDDSTSISDNFILSMLEDNSGNLWIGTRNGLNYLEKKTGKFTKVVVNEHEKKDYHNRIFGLLKIKDGSILFSNSYSQIVKISFSKNIKNIFTTNVLQENVSMFNTTDTSYYINDFKSHKNIFYNISSSKAFTQFSNGELGSQYQIIELPTNDLLIGRSDNLILVNNEGEILKTILSNKTINKIFTDSKKNIWVGTMEGLYVFKNGDINKSPVFLQHAINNAHSIGSNNIQSISEDRDGLMWIGTSEAGVSIYDSEKNVFSVFDQYSDILLAGNSAWGIYQDSNELWVGTSNGLSHIVFENNVLSDAYHSKNIVLKSEVFTRTAAYPNSICNSFVSAILKDKEGNFWFGTHGGGISVYHPATKRWEHFNTSNSVLKSDIIFHLMLASDGKIWISTMACFYSYDSKTKEMKPFLSMNYKGVFPSGYIISTCEDKDGTIWVSSTAGIYHVKNNGDKIAFYFSDEANSRTLSYNMGTTFLRDSKNRFWVATLGGGINLFDEKTNTFRAFNQKNGLSNDICYSMLEDANNNIWISTNSGLSCFNPETATFTNYSEKDGLVANEFTQNAGFKNACGELLFGSPEGLVVFQPTKLKPTINELPIVLSSVKVNYNVVPFSSSQAINLFYEDKTIAFEFATPDFKNQGKIQYSFQLQGFDNEWHDVHLSNRIASYTNLPFGEYIFKVRVKIGNGEWQQKELSVQLNVIAPLWLSPWFVILEVLVLIIIIVLLVRYYSQRKLKKHLQEIEMQQKIYQERERISRDLHDNVGSNLTYITSSLDTISYKIEKQDKNLSQEKIDALSDYTRSTMQQLRETIWAINKDEVTIEELKNKIQDYVMRMTEAAGMESKLIFLNKENLILKPSFAINSFRIVQEAINNAVKHSSATLLTVTISEALNNSIRIEIADNGKGIDKNKSNEGYGMKNMADRVKDLNGEFKIDSEVGAGTKIQITIPL